jgi:hypothetical protein
MIKVALETYTLLLTVIDYTDPLDVNRSAIEREDYSALIDQSNAGLSTVDSQPTSIIRWH